MPLLPSAAGSYLPPPAAALRDGGDNRLRAPQIPTMAELVESCEAQGMCVRLSTFGPFFRVQANRLARFAGDLENVKEIGKVEGFLRPWIDGIRVLHLDSMRMTKQTMRMENKSIFGLSIFLGAVALRHGLDMGCHRAELLAINDNPLYHAKLVRFYGRMGFHVVCEVDGSSLSDLAHMMVWGGRGTRMNAQIRDLLRRWSHRLRPPPPPPRSNSL